MSDSLSQKQQAVEAINKARHILLAIPQRAGGDHFSSITGLSQALNDLNKNIFAVFSGEIDDKFKFIDLDHLSSNLTGSKEFILVIDQERGKADHLGYKLEEGKLKITITPEKGNFKPDDVSYKYGDYQYDLIITLGVKDLKQLGDIYRQDPEIFYKTRTVNIDNNQKNEQFGEINWIDNQASSISEMMIALLESLGVKLNQKIATCLLAGLLSATDQFKAANTTSKALTVGAQLIGAGAQRDKIVKNLFETDSYQDVKGWGRIMENLNIDTTLNFAYSVLDKDDLIGLNIKERTINQGIDRMLIKIKEADLVAIIRQKDKGAKISLRSDGDIDVSRLAGQYGGGGREDKAGFDLKDDDFNILKKKAIKLIKDYLKENQ